MPRTNNNQMSCFTIGHSNYAIEAFLKLLKERIINCLVDVRSSPYSKYVPQFNRENLSDALKKENIQYVYKGDQLGGRYMESDLLYPDGTVDYSKVFKTKEFQNGIQSVIRNITKGLNIVLMCSEKDPLDCHRFLLVAKALSAQGVQVKHILSDGSVIIQTDLEESLVRKYNDELSQFSFFEENLSPEQALEKAYRKRNREVAYTVEKVKEEA
ncbi:MAG: DUF488 domain-containing protein [Candidatus Omnitrophica bacterium]|nr:DUF488 domain-containing protein [Candidatus Omnitrophota bacterium]